MVDLSEITKGVCVKGLIGPQPVTVVAVDRHGPGTVSVVYKTEQGVFGETMAYAFDAERYEIVNPHSWCFDADADEMRLVSEAYRIRLAHLFDPYLAVRTSSIEPLPHQISAVYREMLPRLPLRYVLADDPGAGKTVMTGLLVKEMIARGDLRRCLIVAPGNLVEQWQDELLRKFDLKFRILTNDVLESAGSGNAFTENDLCIARLDKLSRSEDVRRKLERSTWDLVVCDEAHKMSATNFGGEAKYTGRYRLGMLLGELTENLLLLTATPHNGKPADFRYFMALVDRDRFAGANRVKNPTPKSPAKGAAKGSGAGSAGGTAGYSIGGGDRQGRLFPVEPATPKGADVSDCMRRLVKEELLKFDGRPLFPERRAYTVEYGLSPAERGLYDAVTEYVRGEFNRADALADGKRRTSVGFALTILQRRLASSPEAIYQSLKRRRERLEKRLLEVRNAAKPAASRDDDLNGFSHGSPWFSEDPDPFDEDDYDSGEFEEMEEDLVDTASAAATAAELEAEIATLTMLERRANAVRLSGEDRKWEELSRLLQDDGKMFDAGGRREKLIVFTEHRDTFNYLAGKTRSLLGDPEAVLTICGGMSRDARRYAEERFKQDAGARILVATDAAGEGINLQRAHLMINYDLPWNPNRLEQRFGRIHRIGQTEVCHLWNLVAAETREGEVFRRLFGKLEIERAALGGKVFDILGRLTFGERSLRDLLIEAVRYGDDPKVKERLNQAVDASVNQDALRELLREYALTTEVMDAATVGGIREEMERAEVRKLEPHFIEAFFKEAMRRLGGRMAPREPGRYEVLDVPFDVRAMDMRTSSSPRVLRSYERICFSKDAKEGPGLVPAELVCPGHPLLDAVVAVLIEQMGQTLRRGTVFVDDRDLGTEPRLLLYIEGAIQDGVLAADGTRRTVSKSFEFVEVDAAGNAVSAGYAPYLDYRAVHQSERARVDGILARQGWLGGDVERRATDFAIEKIVPRHLEEVRRQRLAQIKKAEKAVVNRLGREAEYWDSRAWELEGEERAGNHSAKLNSQNARRRADEYRERLELRRARFEQERNIAPAPPRVLGAALVVPVGALVGAEQGPDMFARRDTKKIELIGMNAVMAIERELGNEPADVSAQKCGYDVESRVPEGGRDGGPALRMIEVKGRVAGADTVTVSHNEVLCALNSPDSFILAIAEVEGDRARMTYIMRPFTNPLDYATTSCNYNIGRLKQIGEVVLEKELAWQ